MFRHWRQAALIVSLVSLWMAVAPAAAQAQNVTFRFKGAITDRFGDTFPEIAPGTPLTGCYTFNLDAADDNSLPTVGDYWHHAAPYGIIVNIGSHRFQTDPNNVMFLVETVNDHGTPSNDNYLALSYNNLPIGYLPVNYIAWQLDGTTLQATDTTALSAVPPDLTKWSQQFGLTIDMPGTALRGIVSEIAVATTPECQFEPEPGGTVGPQGPPGPEGPQGPMGPEGPAGPEGPQGPAGPEGPQGPVGPQGPAGPAGVEGPKGDRGDVGPMGPAGAAGPKGDPGEGLMPGSLLMLPAGSPAPPRYTYVGTFDLTPSLDSRGRNTAMSVDVYRRND